MLEAAASAAASTGHGRIGTLDLLRGLATHGAGNAAAVLAACGVTADALWQYVQRTPRAEDPSPAFYWTGRNDPAMRTRMCLTFALLCATLTVALGLVDGGGHVDGIELRLIGLEFGNLELNVPFELVVFQLGIEFLIEANRFR